MTNKDYSDIQRLLGNIEGAVCGIDNDEIKNVIYDALESLDVIIDRLKGENDG